MHEFGKWREKNLSGSVQVKIHHTNCRYTLPKRPPQSMHSLNRYMYFLVFDINFCEHRLLSWLFRFLMLFQNFLWMFTIQSTIPVQNKTAVFTTKPCCTADFQITSDKMSLKKVLREFRPWKPSLMFAELHFVFLSRSNIPFISTFLERLTRFYPRVDVESFVLGTCFINKTLFQELFCSRILFMSKCILCICYSPKF